MEIVKYCSFDEDVTITTFVNTKQKINKISCGCSCTDVTYYKMNEGYEVIIKTKTPKFDKRLTLPFTVVRECKIEYVNKSQENIKLKFICS